MRLLNRARLVVAVSLYLFVLFVFVYPTGMAKRAWMALRNATPAERRQANAAHVALWGHRLAVLARPVMGFRVRVLPPDDPHGLLYTHNVIYVFNHRSSLDALVAPEVEVALGDLDTGWLIKPDVIRYPALGRVMSGCGYGVVARKKDVPDMGVAERALHNDHVLDEFARLARSDGRSVAVFPEGTRFTGAKPGAKRQHVGALRKAGFRRLCERLPDYPVVSVTVLWPGAPSPTIFEAASLCDTTVDVRVVVHPHVRPEDADAFLEEDFDEKERLLAAVRRA